MKTPLALLALAALPALGAAQVNVFLDYTGIDAQIDAGWADAGFSPLTAAERDGVRNAIEPGLETVFAGFNANFTTTNPGGNVERVTFGTYQGAGFYGLAAGLDWRNTRKNEVTQVYTRTHGEILAPSFSRAENLRRYRDGIANTAAHELGHNIGLQHYDVYGIRSIYTHPVHGSTYGNTGGVQGSGVMGTGDNGATLDDFARLPVLTELERMKLEYADGFSPALGLTINESATAHGTRATAQPLTFQTLSLSNVPAVNVAGNLAAGTSDFYSFQAFQGASFLANILSDDVELAGNGSLDSILRLYDASGTLLFTNDDLTYNGNTFNQGGPYGLDSIILNYEFAAAGLNTYFLEVDSFSATESGNYNLLIRPVPEPATLAALGLGLAAFLRRRKR